MQQGNTKERIVEAYIELESERPLEKITVTALVERSRITRKTFYYYFKDIYDLLEWIYTNEVIEKIKNIESDSPAENWQQEFLYVFEYILDNKKFVYNTYYSVSRALFLNFIYKQTNMLLTRVIDEKSKKIAVQNKNKKFIADFYKYAFVGLVQEWIENGMLENPEEIIKKLSIMLEGSFDSAIERLSF